MCMCVFWQLFFINTHFIKHDRHFMSTYFLLDAFEFPYYFYRGEYVSVNLPTDPKKKMKLIIYYLIIRNNSSPSIGVLQKNNVVYKFKCPLGDCMSDNNNIYVSSTSTTLSRRLTMHLSDTSSIAQHLKKHSCPTTQFTKNSHRQHNNIRTSK